MHLLMVYFPIYTLIIFHKTMLKFHRMKVYRFIQILEVILKAGQN